MNKDRLTIRLNWEKFEDTQKIQKLLTEIERKRASRQ